MINVTAINVALSSSEVLVILLPKLLPKSKTWMKDLAVNSEERIGDKVHLPAIIRSMNSKSIFEE